jgi:Ca-activated chloride channel family protein
VGLWVFSTFLDGERDYIELVPPGPLRDTRSDIEQSVQSLIADGGTGLYDSTAATVQAVRDGLDPSKINAVVLLSDGMCEDDPPGCELDPLLQFLGSSERETVRVFPVAYGEDADVEALQAIADATSARLYLATDPLTIERVFQSVISNF